MGNNRVREIDTNGIITTVAGTGIIGFSGDGGAATAAALNLKHGPEFSNGLAIDSSGNLYISDYGNGRIRKVDASGVITTVAGGGAAAIANGISAKSAAILPGPLAVDSNGNLYFGQVVMTLAATIPTIYKIDGTGRLTPYAGGSSGVVGVESGPAISTPIGYAACLAADNLGNLYICDATNDRVREVSTAGMMSTIAGNGKAPGGAIQSGTPTATAIGGPTAVAVDSSGDIFIYSTGQVIEIDSTGALTPVAGSNLPPFVSAGDGGAASQATFASVAGMALDPSGNLYLSDGGVYLREALPVGPNGAPPIISSGGVIGAGLSAPPLQLVSPGGMVSIFGTNFSPSGTQRLVEAADINSGKLPTSLAGICVSFGGIGASLAGVFPNQLNVLVPALPVGPVTVQVTADCGSSHPVKGNRGGVAADVASPEFFSQGGAIAATGINGPIVAGGTVEAYGTGWGATSPAIAPGTVPGGATPLAALPSLTIGGEAVPAANILYAGLSPCCAGIYQLDFVIPNDVPAGKLPLILTVGAISSPGNTYLVVGGQ